MSAWNPQALHDVLVWMSLLAGAGCVTSTARGMWRGRSLRHRTRTLLGTSAEAGGEQQPSKRREQGPSERDPSMSFLDAHRKGLARWTARQPMRETAAALGAGAFAVTVVGGVTGWLVAGVAGCCVWRWMRARKAHAQPSEEETGALAAGEQLPLAAELMAACLAAGSSPRQAADAVGRSLGGPLGVRLIRAATELRLGAEPAAAWGRFEPVPGGDRFARCMERAGTAGVPAVDPVTRFATELRTKQAREASAQARRAAVLVTGPLGLCFLPAFLAVGVAPVVLGLARSLL
jgi:Flp pilus assembly protein TadB